MPTGVSPVHSASLADPQTPVRGPELLNVILRAVAAYLCILGLGLCIVRLALAQLPATAEVAADADIPEDCVRLRMPRCGAVRAGLTSVMLVHNVECLLL